MKPEHEPKPKFTTETLTETIPSADSVDEAAAGSYGKP
jgi:hypothetical protein